MDEFTMRRLAKQQSTTHADMIPDDLAVALAVGSVLIKDATARYLRSGDENTRDEVRRLVREFAVMIG